MRIAIDVRREPNSGVGRVAETLAARLAPKLAREHHVDLLVNSGESPAGQNPRAVVLDELPHSRHASSKLAQFFSDEGVDLFINPNTTWVPSGATPTINIVHDTWMLYHPEWMPSLEEFSERFRIAADELKAGIDEHFTALQSGSVFTDYGLELFQNPASQKHQIALMQYGIIMGASAGIVCVSEQVQRDILKIYKAPKSITTIHNIVEGYEPEQARRPREFLCLSKLERRKNLGFLLDAYSEYCQKADSALPLVIAGTRGYAQYREQILNRIEQMQLQGMDVRYLGPIGSHELPDHFSESCALVVTSLAEGFGLPAMEGLMAKLPVISTPVGVIAHESSVFTQVDIASPASLAAALTEVQQQPPTPDQLERTMQVASAAYSADKICQEWLDYLDQFFIDT